MGLCSGCVGLRLPIRRVTRLRDCEVLGSLAPQPGDEQDEAEDETHAGKFLSFSLALRIN